MSNSHASKAIEKIVYHLPMSSRHERRNTLFYHSDTAWFDGTLNPFFGKACSHGRRILQLLDHKPAIAQRAIASHTGDQKHQIATAWTRGGGTGVRQNQARLTGNSHWKSLMICSFPPTLAQVQDLHRYANGGEFCGAAERIEASHPDWQRGH